MTTITVKLLEQAMVRQQKFLKAVSIMAKSIAKEKEAEQKRQTEKKLKETLTTNTPST